MYTIPILIGITIATSFGFIVTVVDNYYLKERNEELENELNKNK